MTNLSWGMRRKGRLALCLIGLGLAHASVAQAQSRNFMMNECSSAGQTYFRDFTAETDMQYNGQRTDGTHAINGRIYLETRFEDFACSYNRAGNRMVGFVAEGRSRPNPLPGGSGNANTGAGADVVRVRGLSANDTLNVRSGPGTGFRVVGALANGDSVRRLQCQSTGNAMWCQIEMMTDMRERGWVNARYLSGGGGGAAVQQPSKPPSAPAGRAVVVRFPPGASGTELAEQLAPAETRRYLLGARNRQFLYFRLASRSAGLSWRLMNPDGSLLDQGGPDKEYRGQLWQSGDHMVEVRNASGRLQRFSLIFAID